MKPLIIILILIGTVACKPARLAERTIIRDTTIYVRLPADTLYDTVKVREGAFSILTSGYANSLAWINSGKLYHRLDQPEKYLPVTVRQAVKTTTGTTTNAPYPTGRESQGLTTIQKIQVFLGNTLLIALAALILVKLMTNLAWHRA